MLQLYIQVEDATTHEASTYAFAESPVRIGRNPLNDLVLDHPFVSRFHGVVRFDDRGTYYVDVGSSVGSELDGLRVPNRTEHPVGPQNEVRIGNLRLRCGRTDQEGGTGRFGIAAKPPIAESGTRKTAFFGDPAPRPDAPVDPAQVQAALGRIGPFYDAYRQAWGTFFEQTAHYLQTLPPPARESLLREIASTCPAAANEPDLRRLVDNLGLDGTPLAEAGSADLEAFLTKLVGPNEGRRATDGEALDILGSALEAFADAYVELSRGTEQLTRDMALKSATRPVGGAATGRDLLRHLLSERGQGRMRVHELTRALAGIALHQVAMMNGVLAGARSMLSMLSPGALTTDPGASSPPINGHEPSTTGMVPYKEGLLDRILPFRHAALFRRYIARHRDLASEDFFVRELFGQSFARAYYTVSGGVTSYVPGNDPAATATSGIKTDPPAAKSA